MAESDDRPILGPDPNQSSGSVATVIVAGLANLAIAVAKLVAGLLSSSAAMLSEAAHSFADTTTEMLLFAALRRGRRPADVRHPFGHGKESYLWALLAAVFTFVAGAGFSITHGVHTIRVGETEADFGVAYIVLAVAFVMETISLIRAARQVHAEARRWQSTPGRFLRHTADTAIKAVFFEDVAALIGLLLAVSGLGLTELTGDQVWDGLASVAIGLLLLVVASILAHTNLSLLVGRAVPPRVRDDIGAELAALPLVRRVDTLLTMQLGPLEVLVAAKVDFVPGATSDDLEATADEAERRLNARFPTVRHVFLDPTAGRAPGPVAMSPAAVEEAATSPAVVVEAPTSPDEEIPAPPAAGEAAGNRTYRPD